MLYLLREFNRLSVSFTRKVKANAAFPYRLAILLFLASQLLQVLAFFLPLKVLILIGSEGVPSYLHSYVTNETKSQFIVALAIGALICYLLYALCDYAVILLGKQISEKIRTKAQKISLIANLESLANDLIIRLIKSGSTYFMVFAGFVLGFLIEWRLFALLVIVLITEYWILSLKWQKYSMPEHSALKERFLRNRNTIFTIVSSINFFIGFCGLFFLVYQEEISNLIIAILLILLIRQISQRILLAVNDGIFLFTNKENVMAIFYSQGIIENKIGHHQKSFEYLISQTNIKRTFNDQLQYMEIDLSEASLEWVDITQPQVALFKMGAKSLKNNTQLWLKTYGGNKKSDFEKEQEFLSSVLNSGVKQASVLLSGETHGLFYILFETPLLNEIPEKEFKHCKEPLFLNLWKLKPTASFNSRICRSIPSLCERLTSKKLESLTVAVGNAFENETLEKTIKQFEDILYHLKQVPKSLVNKDLSLLNARRTPEGNIILLNWHKVTLEPICSSIVIKQLERFVDYHKLVQFLKSVRDDCDNLTLIHLRLSGLLGELDRCIQKRHFKQGLSCLEPILDCLDELNST